MKRLLFLFASLALAQTTRSVWDGVFTADQAKRGHQVYTNVCASCLGSELTGGESAPALAGCVAEVGPGYYHGYHHHYWR